MSQQNEDFFGDEEIFDEIISNFNFSGSVPSERNDDIHSSNCKKLKPNSDASDVSDQNLVLIRKYSSMNRQTSIKDYLGTKCDYKEKIVFHYPNTQLSKENSSANEIANNFIDNFLNGTGDCILSHQWISILSDTRNEMKSLLTISEIQSDPLICLAMRWLTSEESSNLFKRLNQLLTASICSEIKYFGLYLIFIDSTNIVMGSGISEIYEQFINSGHYKSNNKSWSERFSLFLNLFERTELNRVIFDYNIDKEFIETRMKILVSEQKLTIRSVERIAKFYRTIAICVFIDNDNGIQSYFVLKNFLSISFERAQFALANIVLFSNPHLIISLKEAQTNYWSKCANPILTESFVDFFSNDKLFENNRSNYLSLIEYTSLTSLIKGVSELIFKIGLEIIDENIDHFGKEDPEIKIAFEYICCNNGLTENENIFQIIFGLFSHFKKSQIFYSSSQCFVIYRVIKSLTIRSLFASMVDKLMKFSYGKPSFKSAKLCIETNRNRFTPLSQEFKEYNWLNDDLPENGSVFGQKVWNHLTQMWTEVEDLVKSELNISTENLVSEELSFKNRKLLKSFVSFDDKYFSDNDIKSYPIFFFS